MNTSAFLRVLPLLLKGFLGVFIVTAVIILSVVILNRISYKK